MQKEGYQTKVMKPEKKKNFLFIKKEIIGVLDMQDYFTSMNQSLKQKKNT